MAQLQDSLMRFVFSFPMNVDLLDRVNPAFFSISVGGICGHSLGRLSQPLEVKNTLNGNLEWQLPYNFKSGIKLEGNSEPS